MRLLRRERTLRVGGGGGPKRRIKKVSLIVPDGEGPARTNSEILLFIGEGRGKSRTDLFKPWRIHSLDEEQKQKEQYERTLGREPFSACGVGTGRVGGLRGIRTNFSEVMKGCHE